MKKVFLVLALAMSAQFASASECTVEKPCGGNGNPTTITNVWGLTGEHTPKIAAGSYATDEAGNKELCPAFIYGGCSDITRTDYYRNGMIETARQIKGYGMEAQFPQFAYWYKLVK